MYNRYVTTTFENPKEYYWNQIQKSLDAMTRKQETKDYWINLFKKSLRDSANELGVSTDSKKLTSYLCLIACRALLQEMVFTFGYRPHVGYALEYYVYAPTWFDMEVKPRTPSDQVDTYYHRTEATLSQTIIKNNVISAILNNEIDEFSNTIIDLDNLREDLRRVVASFYEENPDLQQSPNRIPELQTLVTKQLAKLETELNLKAQDLKKSNRNLKDFYKTF